MPRPSKQQVEWHYFSHFQRDYADLPPGTPEHGDKPDIVINGPRTIGIEIVNFYRESGNASEQAQRPLRKKVIESAQGQYEKKAGRLPFMTFGFNAAVPIRDWRKLATQIANFAASLASDSKGEIGRHLFPHIPELSSIWNAGYLHDPAWKIIGIGSGSLMDLDSLQAIVDGKDALCAAYKSCDEFWLLVVVDFINPGQDQEIRLNIDSITSRAFKRVIVYKPQFSQIIERRF